MGFSDFLVFWYYFVIGSKAFEVPFKVQISLYTQIYSGYLTYFLDLWTTWRIFNIFILFLQFLGDLMTFFISSVSGGPDDML